MRHPTGLSTADKTRYHRAYQSRRRGGKSWKTFAEDAAVLCALAAGEVTTPAAAQVLGVDIVGVRERLNEMVEEGVKRVQTLLSGRIEDLKKELESLTVSHNGEQTNA